MSKMKNTIKKLAALIIVSIMLITSSIYVTAVENDNSYHRVMQTDEIIEVSLDKSDEEEILGIASMTQSEYDSKMNSFISDDKWKNGASYSSSQSPKLSTWSSIGCFAYGCDFSKYMFDINNFQDGETFGSASQIRAGDVIIIKPQHVFCVLGRDGNTLYTAEGATGNGTVAHVGTDRFYLSNGSLKTIWGDAISFAAGYHLVNISSSCSSKITNTDATYSSLSGTDVTIVSTINNPNGELIYKAGFWIAMKDSPKNHIIDYVEDASVADTYFWQWYTMSEKGVTLQPGIEYVFQLWVEANGVRAESPIGSVKAISSSSITNTEPTYSDLSGTDVTIVSTIDNPNGELINKAGFWIAMKDSPKNHIIDYVENANVTDTHFWQWYTMSEKGVILQPGVEYVFQLWVEANGVRAESPIGSLKTEALSVITNTDSTYSDLTETDVTIVSTIDNPRGELINRAGFWIARKDSSNIHIIDYVENASVTDTHFWQWYTMSEKGVTLQPGVEYVFRLWVEANGVRAESPIGIVKTNGIYDTENPVITDVKIENLTMAGYDISCVVMDNVGVTSVCFESWTVNNGKDDVVVCEGTFDKIENRWYSHVNVSEHNGEVGNYKNRITAYDACQNSANTLTEDVFVGDNGKDSSSSSSKDSSSSSSKSGSSSSSKDRILDDKIDSSSMEKVTSASGTTFFVGDSLVVDLVGIDSEKLHVKGKAGSYKVVTDLVSGKRVGVITAMKKGTVKLYTVNGKKKITACVLKAEQPKIKKSLKLKMGKSKKLKISGTKIKPDTWVSSDQSIISVNSDGTVTAKKAGTAIVTATIGKHSFNCNVIVK